MDVPTTELSPVEQPTQEDPNINVESQVDATEKNHQEMQPRGEEVQPKEQQQDAEEETSEEKGDASVKNPFELSSSGTILTFTNPVSSVQELTDLIRGLGSRREAITSLNFEYEYEDDTPKINLDLNLDLLLPALESLRLCCVAWSGFNLKSSTLQCLEIDNPVPGSDGKFAFRFPNLRRFDSQFLYLDDPSDFAASLSSSPKLTSLTSYKLWGLGGHQGAWYLPSCTDISLYRADDLTKLKLYCPRLLSLNLRACYAISSVTLLKRGKTDHKDYNIKKEEDMSCFDVNMINCCSHALASRLRKHPRVVGVAADEPEENEGRCPQQ